MTTQQTKQDQQVKPQNIKGIRVVLARPPHAERFAAAYRQPLAERIRRASRQAA